MCEMSGSMAKLIGSNGTICYACGVVPGLTHPSQALSGVCSPPPHPKHQYLDICTWRNLIHKCRDKQWHRCTHTLSYRHRNPLTHGINISTQSFSQNMPQTSAQPSHAHAYIWHRRNPTHAMHGPIHVVNQFFCKCVCVGWYWKLFSARHWFVSVSHCRCWGT